MADNSFQIGDREFKVSKINAMKQYHIVRKIAPILGELLPNLKEIAVSKKDVDAMNSEEQFEQIAKIASPIMNGLSKLNDKDSEYVLYSLLAAVEMKQGSGNWARIVTGESTLMFQDLDLATLIQAAGRAFMFNMSGFFAVLQRTS